MATRRGFLKSSAAVVGGSWAAFAAPASLSLMELACTNRKAGRFQALTLTEGAELEALTALIVPSDATGPGAREAGAVWYIDAIAAQDQDDLSELREGIALLRNAVRAQSDNREHLHDLDPEEQVQVARAIEDTDFFRAMRDATITGMFAHPRHGGNRDKLGWQLLGFDDRHAWQPPFGHYDAPYHEDPDSLARTADSGHRMHGTPGARSS